jgi:anaerobic selenocysteine-containing dehydrogenase
MAATAEAAQVILPLSSAVETEGTFTNHERRISIPAGVSPRDRIGGRLWMQWGTGLVGPGAGQALPCQQCSHWRLRSRREQGSDSLAVVCLRAAND